MAGRKACSVAGELESCAQVKATLVADVDALRLKLRTTEEMLAAATRKSARLAEELDAQDKTMVIYDPAIKPGDIEPIHEWIGNYGKRGQLRQFLIETFQSRAPEFVSTTEIAMLVVMNFSMVFVSDESRRLWLNGSLRGSLKVLVKKGFLERDPDCEMKTGVPMGWRWKEKSQPTLAQLSATKMDNPIDLDSLPSQSRATVYEKPRFMGNT